MTQKIKQPKQAKSWMLCDNDGVIHTWVIDHYKRDLIKKVERNYQKNWRFLMKQGYRAIKVKIQALTPEK